MALKGDRQVVATESRFKASSTTMAAGGVVSLLAAASGTESTVSYATNPSGAYPIGVLLAPVGDYDWTDRPRYTEKLVLAYGEQVPLLTIGTINTNMVTGVPSLGEKAYLAASGKFSNTQAAGALEVGQFTSNADADGYYYIDIRL